MVGSLLVTVMQWVRCPPTSRNPARRRRRCRVAAARARPAGDPAAARGARHPRGGRPPGGRRDRGAGPDPARRRSPPRRSTTSSARWPGPGSPAASNRPAAPPCTRRAPATTTTTSSAGAAATVADVDCTVGESPCLDPSHRARLRGRRGRSHLLGPLPRLPSPAHRRLTHCQLHRRARPWGTRAWHAGAVADDDGDLGLFGPDSVSWRLHASRSCWSPACGRSTCRPCTRARWPAWCRTRPTSRDPWGRLERTGNYVATTVYGTTAQARRPGGGCRRSTPGCGPSTPYRRDVPDRRARPAALGTRHRGGVVPDRRGTRRRGAVPRGDRPVLRRAAGRRDWSAWTRPPSRAAPPPWPTTTARSSPS